MTLILRYAARSDRGLVRTNNEDSVYAGARLLALADGMGGHAAGEVASQLVIAALAHLDDDEPGGDLLNMLDTAVREGNSAIAAHVELDPELEGMGTTLTAILFAGNRLGLVHVGDSRGYLLRDGELAQITKDDTFVQTLVDEGRITAEEAHSHPQRSLIMRALTGHEVEPTLTMREAHAGDRYLLCSDGLSDPVSQETIKEALQIPDVAESADRLIELALRGGGPDNVTVVVADVVGDDFGPTQPILAGAVSGYDDQSDPPDTAAGRASAITPRRDEAKRVAAEPEPPPRKKRTKRRIIFAAVLIVLLVLAALAIGGVWVSGYYYVSTRDRTVAIMRGIPGNFLGVALQKPYRLGCLDAHNELKLINVGENPASYDCQLFSVKFLKQSDAKQVADGLPTGSQDEANTQMKELARKALPVCPTTPPAEATPKPSPTTATPAPPTTFNQPNAPAHPGPPPGPTEGGPGEEPPDREPPPGLTPQPPTSPQQQQSPTTTQAQPTQTPQPDVDCRKAA